MYMLAALRPRWTLQMWAFCTTTQVSTLGDPACDHGKRRLTNAWLCRLCAFRVLKVAYDEGIVGWDGSGVHYRGVPQDPTHHGRSANSAHRIG